MSAAQTAAKAAIINGNSSSAYKAASEAIELIVMKMKSQATEKTEEQSTNDQILAIRD
jgi:hypothetical protein